MRMNAAGVRRLSVVMVAALLAGLGGARPGVAADAVEAFYKGKTMRS
jgi:hypothetical protein